MSEKHSFWLIIDKVGLLRDKLHKSVRDKGTFALTLLSGGSCASLQSEKGVKMNSKEEGFDLCPSSYPSQADKMSILQDFIRAVLSRRFLAQFNQAVLKGMHTRACISQHLS